MLTGDAFRSLDSLAEAAPVENVIGRFPRLDPSRIRLRPAEFRNPAAPRPAGQRLFSPLPKVPRTAVLMEGFQEIEGVQVFGGLRRRKLARFRPNILAGPVCALRAIAEGAEDRGACVPRVSHAVIAFTLPLHGFLSEEARHLFWRVFEVPVFSQLIGFEGEMLAWECEAHEGLHIESENAVFELDQRDDGDAELVMTSLVNLRTPVLRLGTGLTGTIEQSACGCGLRGPRLLGLHRRKLCRPEPAAVFAASAACASD